MDYSGVSAAMCVDLSDPENGTVNVVGTAPSSTATYECDSGFQLEGSVVLTCGTDGEWTPTPPVCQRSENTIYYTYTYSSAPNSSFYKMGMITIDNTHPLASFNYHPYN